MIKADLHGHPEFFNPERVFRLTEWHKVSLDDLRNVELDGIPISDHHDTRWEHYLGKNVPPIYSIGKHKYLIHTREIQALHEGKRIDINVICPVDDSDIRQIKPKERSLDYVLDAVRASGGIICLVHQEDIELIRKLLEEGKADINEQYNWIHGKEILIPGHKGIAVSDAHLLRDYGRAYTIFSIDELNIESLNYALKNQKFELVFKESFGNNVARTVSRLKYSANVTEAIIRGKLGFPS